MAVIEMSSYAKKVNKSTDIDLNSFRYMLERWDLYRHYEKCCVCNWSKCGIDLSHLVPYNQGGNYAYDNIIPLCPNHHKQLLEDKLDIKEMESVQYFLWNISNQISPFI